MLQRIFGRTVSQDEQTFRVAVSDRRRRPVGRQWIFGLVQRFVQLLRAERALYVDCADSGRRRRRPHFAQSALVN